MSLTPVRPNPAPTFSDDWKPAISASRFASIPPNTILAIFRKCDLQELGHLAVVCKAIRFFSEANEVWQDKYLERWSISLKWVENLPDCWKAKVQKLFELMAEDEPHLSWSDMFWEHGLANAAISEAQKNLAQPSKKRWYPQQSLRAKEAGAGLDFSKELIKAPSSEEKS